MDCKSFLFESLIVYATYVHNYVYVCIIKEINTIVAGTVYVHVRMYVCAYNIHEAYL